MEECFQCEQAKPIYDGAFCKECYEYLVEILPPNEDDEEEFIVGGIE